MFQIDVNITGIEPVSTIIFNISNERFSKPNTYAEASMFNCGEYRSRTDDLLRARQAL